jgi:hypothetical protein
MSEKEDTGRVQIETKHVPFSVKPLFDSGLSQKDQQAYPLHYRGATRGFYTKEALWILRLSEITYREKVYGKHRS